MIFGMDNVPSFYSVGRDEVYRWIDRWNDGRPRPKKGTFGDKSTENENGGVAPENGMGLEKWSESRLK